MKEDNDTCEQCGAQLDNPMARRRGRCASCGGGQYFEK